MEDVLGIIRNLVVSDFKIENTPPGVLASKLSKPWEAATLSIPSTRNSPSLLDRALMLMLPFSTFVRPIACVSALSWDSAE